MNTLLKVIQLHKNEAQLIKKAVQNNRDAQRVLFDLHAPKMLSVCRYYISDVQDAEEVMLNGFFKVFKYLNSYKGSGSFEGWIRRIMVREAISHLRKKKSVEFSTEDFANHQNTDDYLNSEIDATEIQFLIDGLPTGYRMVFVLYALEGYKHNEIADMLKISEGTSKSQLFKARKLLQAQLKKVNKISNGTN